MISVANLKRALLRTEKNFGQSVIEPLKKILINGATPDYRTLISQGSQHGSDIMAAARARQQEIEMAADIVQGPRFGSRHLHPLADS